MLRQTEAYQLNPVTRCMSKDHMLNKWYCVAKTTEVTITSGLPGGMKYVDKRVLNILIFLKFLIRKPNENRVVERWRNSQRIR